MTWSTFAADVPRFVLPSNYMLIEGQRTNLIRNPRGEGAVAGSPGTLPTYAGISPGSGLTFQVLGAGRSNGIDYVDMRLSGTAGSSSSGYRPDETYAAPVVNGQTYTASALITFLAPPVGITGASIHVSVADAGGGVLPGHTLSVSMSLTDGVMSRPQIAMPVTNADAVGLRMQIYLKHDIGSVVDVSFRIGWPQVEVGTFASTPILPPVGTPGASTRGADLVSASLASLGISANGACTVLWSGALPQAAPSGAPQWLAQVDDGTDLNRFYVSNNGGGAVVTAGRALAAAGADAASAGTMTPGAPFSLGLSIDGSGRLASCMNGGVVQVVSGGPTSGLTTLRLGINASGGDAMFGETREFIVIPYALSDANLAARVAALPL